MSDAELRRYTDTAVQHPVDQTLDRLAAMSDDEFDALMAGVDPNDAEHRVVMAAQDAAARVDLATQQVNLATARLELHAERQAERFDNEMLTAWDRTDGKPTPRATPARGPRPTVSDTDLAELLDYEVPADIESMSETDLAQWFADQAYVDGLLAQAEDVQRGRAIEIDLSTVDDSADDEAALALWEARWPTR